MYGSHYKEYSHAIKIHTDSKEAGSQTGINDYENYDTRGHLK